MTEHEALIEELDRALLSHSAGSRADALQRVADLFLRSPDTFSEPEVAVFDDVMSRLLHNIEEALRASLAIRLAKVANAPRNLIRVLAADRSIEVAGPVLRHSERLDDPTLVATARTSSQDHLLAISQRATIGETVTDILIARGDRTVALSTVNNSGARFSTTGHTLLVERSKNDEDLAAGVWCRTDIPHHQLLKLLSVASDNVRQRLEAVDRSKTQLIRDMTSAVVNEMQDQLRARSRDYAEALQAVRDVHRAGRLDDAQVMAFAKAGRFDATTVALSILCDLPVGACERAMVQDRSEMVIMLARAVGLSWRTTKAILHLRAAPKGISPADLETALNAYSRLKPETAAKALHVVRLRERAAASGSESNAYH